MKQLLVLLSSLFWSQLVNAQEVKTQGKLVINEKLVSRFVKQTSLLRKAAVAQHLRKKVEPVLDWLIPEPGDKMVTYYQQGDTMLFYQSGRTAILHWCSLTHPDRFAAAVPFLANTK